MDAAVSLRIKRDIAEGAAQHGTRSCSISIAMVVQRHCHLDQALEELLFGLGSGSPDVFKRLVGFEKFGPIEEFNTLPTLLEMHVPLWHTVPDLAPN